MEDKQNLTNRIQEICRHANLAVWRDEDMQDAYKAYLQTFEALLSEHLPRKTAVVQEFIKNVFIVYEDMLDNRDQESTQSEKLAQFIRDTVEKLQNDRSAIQDYSMISIIDALMPTDAEDIAASAMSLEDEVDSSIKELEEILMAEQQKSALLTENDLGADDNDQIDREMEAVLKLSAADIYANAGSFIQSESGDIAEMSSQSTDLDETVSFPDNISSSTDDLYQDSTTNPKKDAESQIFYENFAQQFHAIITQFHNFPYARFLPEQDQLDLETTVDTIVKKLLDAYKNCCKDAITEKSLLELGQSTQKVITQWSFWSARDLSDKASPLLGQAFAKLTVNLSKLIEDAQHHLPSIPTQHSPRYK